MVQGVNTGMSAPLIHQDKRKEWGTRMRAACSEAMAAQRRGVRHTASRSVIAAGKSRPTTGVISGAIVPAPWSSDAWANQVQAHVEPVAQAIASEAVSAAKAPLPTEVTMGLPDSGDDMATSLVDAALTAGNTIGDRLNANVGSADTPEDADEEMSAAFDSADDILDNVVGSMAERCAAIATQDVTSFLASSFGLTYSGATKIWRSSDDDHVRDDHVDVDGDEVALNGTFTVGGEDMTGPGDPTASDDQTMGCRCWLDTDGVLPEGTDAPDDYASVDQGGEDA